MGLLDLDLHGEETGSGREAGNGTFMAVAHGTKKRRTDVGGSGGGRVEAQGSKRVEGSGSNRSGAGGDVSFGGCGADSAAKTGISVLGVGHLVRVVWVLIGW